MAGIDYRSLSAPAQVETNLPDSGAAARAAELRRTFQEFEGISSDIYDKAATQAGAIAGAASGATGHPDYKQGLSRFTAYSRAFNNAATGAYAVQAEAQADDTAARLRVEANNDPATFHATYSAVRDAVLKNAPAQAQPILMELYNKRLAAGMAAISGDQATETRNTQRQVYDEGISRQTTRVAALQGSANPVDQAAAEDEHAKLTLLIDGGVNAGLYSKAEAQAMHIGAMRQITSQVFNTQVDRELADPSGNVGLLLENFRKAHLANLADTSSPPILSEAEYQKLYSDATTKIREQRLLDMLTKGQGKTEEEMRWEAGDKQYTDLFLQGKLTDSQLAAAVRTGDVKPEVARALHTQIANGPVIGHHPKELLTALQDPDLPSKTPAEIAAIPGLSTEEKIQVGKEADRQRNNWEGTQPARQAKYAIATALKAPVGGMASDEQRAAAQNATVDFTNRINALPPEKRAAAIPQVTQEVIRAEHAREMAVQLQQTITARQSAFKNKGPGGPKEVPRATFDALMKQYDDRIIELRAQAKGQ
jgi:hypothetical protein